MWLHSTTTKQNTSTGVFALCCFCTARGIFAGGPFLQRGAPCPWEPARGPAEPWQDWGEAVPVATLTRWHAGRRAPQEVGSRA